MVYNEHIIFTTTKGIEHVSNILVAIGVSGFEIIDSNDFKEFLKENTPHYDYIDDSVLKILDEQTRIKVYTADVDQGNNTFKEILKQINNLKASDTENVFGSLEIITSKVDEKNWQDNWKKFFKPKKIGNNLVVCPLWKKYDPQKDDIVLKIDPGMTFGTGLHETTSNCLLLMQEIDIKNKTVLDVGCGSGILSLASVLCGAKNAVGCDIDKVAVEASLKNAKLNNISDKTKYIQGDLFENITGKYQIVFANIVADIVISLLGQIDKFIEIGGYLIVSGIIDERLFDVLSAVDKDKFIVEKTVELNGWEAILLKYSGGK